MRSDNDNGYSYSLDFFTNQRRFVSRRAFLPTLAAPMLASWFYQSLTLFSFVLYSFLHYWVGDDLQYTRYGKTRVSVVLAGVLLNYSLLTNDVYALTFTVDWGLTHVRWLFEVQNLTKQIWYWCNSIPELLNVFRDPVHTIGSIGYAYHRQHWLCIAKPKMSSDKPYTFHQVVMKF